MAHRSVRKRKEVHHLQSPLPEIPRWFAWDHGIWEAYDWSYANHIHAREEGREKLKRRRKLVSQTIKTLAFQALDIIKTAIMENRTETDLWLPAEAQQQLKRCIDAKLKFGVITVLETLEECYKEKA